MASDYDFIRKDNERRYGTDIKRIGQMLLADRYDDRTHFIFEVLQNAEDALARRPNWQGSRAVNFDLGPETLRVSHFGHPFHDGDVRGICGIAESTKDLTAIGRFGIGFKSVYTFTERPEVHSGEEDFAIESYVWPTAVPSISREADETAFILPLDVENNTAHTEIIAGLRKLDPRALLFLRYIEEINWGVQGGPSGLYLRGEPENLGDNVRRIVLLGEEEGKPDVAQTWLVFSRDARTDEDAVVGHVEVAFLINRDEETNRLSVEMVSDSSLVVFFPTVLSTHLGFLVQGPYRTTPSRDNVPRDDPWNQKLVGETASLLVEALRWLRDNDLLDANALECLPLDPTKFTEGSMFVPLFDAVRNALHTEPLLPRHGGGYAPAHSAKLASSQELRELFAPAQLASLFDAEAELAWLSSDITRNRMPVLYQYLTGELGIAEVFPDTILPRLHMTFLEAQPDDWILKLYEFLNRQPALLRRGRLENIPLIRLEDGSHDEAKANDRPLAFLPGAVETGFPTVRRAVCATEEARQFLRSLGLTEPDPVDDIVRNVLPRYGGGAADVDDQSYEADISSIVTAFATDSTWQREKLRAALRDSAFVMAVDAGDGSKRMSKPDDAYIATERLQELFRGVSGVLLVDDAYACLRGDEARRLLEACGATRYLQTVSVEATFTLEELRKMRHEAGSESASRLETPADTTLRGLDQLLRVLPKLDAETRANKAALLWKALADVEDRSGAGAFLGTYRWSYYKKRSSAMFDAGFVRQLIETAWVPSEDGELQRPEEVVFESLGWGANPFLLSKIRFKPPIIEILAIEAGFEPGVLNLLKSLGVTSVAEFQARFGVETKPDPSSNKSPVTADDTGNGRASNGRNDTSGTGRSTEDATGGKRGGGDTDGKREDGGKRVAGSSGGRKFISYVGAHPDGNDHDPDGLDHRDRMDLEDKAIQFILSSEPQLQRTRVNNPGFDLYDAGSNDQRERWIEVKSMTGSLHDRPVGLSRKQFEWACEKGEAYWLYVVEHAGTSEGARIVRVQDPAGKARTFTFDHGWLDVAEVHGAAGVDAGVEDRE